MPADYDPGYPRRLTEAEIRELLRPGLLARFSPRTMAAGALLAAALAGGCRGGGNSAAGQSPSAGPTTRPGSPTVAAVNVLPGPTTRSDAKVRAQVDRIVAEVLGQSKDGFWAKSASIRLARTLSGNPPVKYPHIPISYGNSYIGIFDIEAARKATRRLFEAYGLKLEADVPLNGDGYAFVADGYDRERHVGFKLTTPADAGQVGREGDPKLSPDEALAPAELPSLAAAVKAGRLRIFVADGTAFPNMDGDLRTPMQFYLASVIDYLNWVHGDTQIRLNEVLGQLPGGATTRPRNKDRPALPGCDFENDADLKLWAFTDATGELAENWSSFHRRSLKLTLRPGGRAVYTVPKDQPVLLAQEYGSVSADLFCDTAGVDRARLTVTLIGERGPQTTQPEAAPTWVLDVGLDSGQQMMLREYVNGKPKFDRLSQLIIKSASDVEVTVYVDDIGVRQR